MKTLTLLILLAACAVTAVAKPTGKELVLLRMTLRQEMTADVQAAAPSANPGEKGKTAPLELVLSGVPDRNGLYATMTNPAQDTTTRFHAARALAYLGDTRSIDSLAATLRGQSRSASAATDPSKAALCLLYLGYDFAADFAFSRLPAPLYPELDALVKAPNPVSSGSAGLRAAVALFLATPYPVKLWGPLSVLEAEQESLAAILRDVAEQEQAEALRIPFGLQAYDWEDVHPGSRDGGHRLPRVVPCAPESDTPLAAPRQTRGLL